MRHIGRLDPSDFYHFGYGHLIEKDNCSILVIAMSPLKTHLLIGLESGQMLVVEVQKLLVALGLNGAGE